MNPVLRQILVFSLLCFAIPAAGTLAAPARGDGPQAEWRIEVKHDVHDDPHSTVDLVINGRQTVRFITPAAAGGSTDEFHVLPPEEYEGHEVPARALCACFSLWAGSGTRLYAVANAKGEVEVYRLDEDESDTKQPRWKRVRKIKVK